jgi:endonuclease YncB( thermonuclease family)
VVAVKDGDTIGVLYGGRAETVRLHGIDAPEMGQPFGRAAKQAASRYAFGTIARVCITDVDRYGRLVGEVNVAGGELNEMLVRDGLAWWYRRYAPREGRLESLERAARNANRGLRSRPNPTPPWDWRAQQRSRTADGSRSPIGTARISTRSPRRSAFSTAVQGGRTVLDGYDDKAADEMSATLVRSPHNCSPSDSSSHLPSDLPMSDSGLGDALKSKRSQRAQDGDREAQRVATGVDWSDVGREAERIDNEERPRRKQANIDLPEDLKCEFKAAVQQDGKQMRFVVEDLIRLYPDRAT